AINKYGSIKIIYIHIDDQHPDTMRFLLDCEKWFGIKIEILQSSVKNVDTACRQIGFINSPYGAGCTRLLKKRVRKEWEDKNGNNYTYVWGFDSTEKKRADRLIESMPNSVFPLIENKISKKEAHHILKEAGINRPAMYEMGYPNNNCIGCLKGGMGYWNKIRVDFPDVFKNRCELERVVGGRVFKEFNLIDFPQESGRKPKVICPECDVFCGKNI
ncbi:MAG: phosphoadenosine phosphosulfate reductase, partial [Planctomycetota bacterium]